jgi:hypothetical protein
MGPKGEPHTKTNLLTTVGRQINHHHHQSRPVTFCILLGDVSGRYRCRGLPAADIAIQMCVQYMTAWLFQAADLHGPVCDHVLTLRNHAIQLFSCRILIAVVRNSSTDFRVRMSLQTMHHAVSPQGNEDIFVRTPEAFETRFILTDTHKPDSCTYKQEHTTE